MMLDGTSILNLQVGGGGEHQAIVVCPGSSCVFIYGREELNQSLLNLQLRVPSVSERGRMMCWWFCDLLMQKIISHWIQFSLETATHIPAVGMERDC